MSEFKSSKSKTLATASTLQKVTCPTPVRDPQEILSSGWASAAYQKRYTNRLTNGHPEQGYGVTTESSTDSSDTGRTGSVTGQAVLQRMFGYQRHYKLDARDEEQPDLAHQYLGSPEARAAFFRPRITPALNTQPADTRLAEQLAAPLYRGAGGQAEGRVPEHGLDGEEEDGTDDEDEEADGGRQGDGFNHHLASDGGGGSHVDVDMFSAGPTRSVGSYTAGMPPSRMRMAGGLTHGSQAAAATRFVSPSTHRNGLAHAPGGGHQGHFGGSAPQLPSGLVPSKSETCSSSPRALMQALGVGTGGVRRPFPAMGTRASYPSDGAGTARRASVSGGGMGVGGQALSPASVGPAGVQAGSGGSWSGDRDSGQGRDGGMRLPAAAAAAAAAGSVPRSSNRRASVSGGESTSAPLPSILGVAGTGGGGGGGGGGGQNNGPVATHTYSAAAYHAAANTRARTRRLSLMAGSGGSFLPSGLGAAAGSISPSSPAAQPAGFLHPQPPAPRPGPPAPRQSLPGSGASSFTSPSAGAAPSTPSGRFTTSPSTDTTTANSTTNSQPLPSVRMNSNTSVPGELPSPQLGLYGTPTVTTVTTTTTVVVPPSATSPNGPHHPMHASALRASITASPGVSVPLPSTTPNLRTSFSGNANGTSGASFTGSGGGILSQLSDLHSGGGGVAAPVVNPAVPLSGLNNLAGTGLGDAISQLRGIRATTEKHHQHQLQQPVGAGARQLPSPARDKRPEPGLAGVTPLLLLPVSLPPVESWVAAGRPAEQLDPLHGKRLVDAPLCVMPRPVAEVDLQTRMANHKAAMRDLVRTEGAPMSDTEMEAAKLLSRLEKSGARARNFCGMSDGADEDEEEKLQVEDVR